MIITVIRNLSLMILMKILFWACLARILQQTNCLNLSFIDKKELSLSDVQRLTDVNASDISRIKNKIYSLLDTQHGVGAVLESAGGKIRRMTA